MSDARRTGRVPANNLPMTRKSPANNPPITRVKITLKNPINPADTPSMAKLIPAEYASALRGRIGEVVYSQTKNGVVMRSYTHPRNPRTPAQSQARARFSMANYAFGALSESERLAWDAYAGTQIRQDTRTGATRIPQTKQVFTGLACKFQQVSPDAAIPALPPEFGFAGDPLAVTATVEGTTITFTASAATSDWVRVELMLQPLRSGGCAPIAKRYRPLAFAEFAPGQMRVAVTVPAGWQAPAYQFVHRGTGQEAGFRALPRLQAGAGE